MKRLGYYDKLSLAARWFLPYQDAEEMIEDYRDILSEVHGPEEARERFGTPLQLVMQLADRKKVFQWHFDLILMLFLTAAPCIAYIISYRQAAYHRAAFNMFLCGCVFLLGLRLILAGAYRRPLAVILIILLAAGAGFAYWADPYQFLTSRLYYSGYVDLACQYENVFVVAWLVSMFTYGVEGHKGSPMSKFLLASLISAFLGVAILFGIFLYGANIDFAPLLHLGWLRAISIGAGVVSFAGAVFSLVMARMYDTRWRAVFTLCLLGLIFSMEMYQHCWSMSASLWVECMAYETGDMEIGSILGIQQTINSEYPVFAGVGLVLALIGLL